MDPQLPYGLPKKKKTIKDYGSAATGKWVIVKTGTEVPKRLEIASMYIGYPIDRTCSKIPPPFFFIFASTDHIFIKKKKWTGVDSNIKFVRQCLFVIIA